MPNAPGDGGDRPSGAQEAEPSEGGPSHEASSESGPSRAASGGHASPAEATPGRVFEEAPVAASPAEAPPGPKLRRRPGDRSRGKRIALLVGAGIVGLALLLAAATAAYLWYENNRIHRVAIKHLSAVQQSGRQKDVQNILLIGSTTRCGLAHQNPVFGLCSEGVTGVNSDVVMILHLDPDHHRASILSIPRDTLVPNARHDGVNKIDAALGDTDGPSQLIAAITDDFGIPIQHYVELNFDSFQGVVQALGGVKMYFPMPLYDLQSSLDVPTSGCVALNGFQALAVVRSRHLQYQPPADARVSHYNWPYDPESDLSRIRRDHEFLRVLASAVAHRGLGHFVTDLRLVDSLAGNLQVDSGFSATEMANLVLEFHGVDPNSVPQYTLPVVADLSPYTYRGSGYGDVVFPVQPQDAQVVSQFLGSAPTKDDRGRTLPAPGSFSVAVEDASGVPDRGTQTANGLSTLGYRVTSVSDTEMSAATTETTVLYSDPAKLGDALRVLSSLSGLAVVGYDPQIARGGTANVPAGTAPGTSGAGGAFDVGSPLPASVTADVVVVAGSTFAVRPPPSSTPAAPGSSTTSPPTTSGPGQGNGVPATGGLNSTPVAPGLTSPSSPTEVLQPWDPRSCGAAGRGGP